MGDLFYIQVPQHCQQVRHEIAFLTLDQFLQDQEACQALWDLVGNQFKTRSKFLAIWPFVRFVAVSRLGGAVAGLLLVSAPLNWQIDYVVVHQEARHRGIATALVNETVNQAFARGVPYVMLSSKPSLRSLYEGRCGFTVVGKTVSARYVPGERDREEIWGPTERFIASTHSQERSEGMCGIFAYNGWGEASPFLLEGLERLEYRGYDSAGVAILGDAGLQVRKRAGRVAQLQALLADQPALGRVGIGHTRWATHGPATDANAHPHIGGDGLVAVVHNGIIENHALLRQRLLGEGFHFRTQTDTEALAHLIASCWKGDLVEAVGKALPQVKGAYALAVVSPRAPDLIVGARLGSPLVVGAGDRTCFLASDSRALRGRAERVVYLDDNQVTALTPGRWEVFDAARRPVSSWTCPLFVPEESEDKAGFAHYMLKEIHEQPETLWNALHGRLDATHFGELGPDDWRRVRRLLLTGCGTSYHAGLVGQYLLEDLARLPVKVEYASELRYRDPPVEPDTLVIAISQSGETADTLAAMREGRRKGLPTLAICNVVGSTIARDADGVVYLHAGPEVGVASTKAFTAQVAVLMALALYLGRLRGTSGSRGEALAAELRVLPATLDLALRCQEEVRRVAAKYARATTVLYLGRQYLYPVALEGALKLKEISYIHAEGYPAAEMKHGPIALIDEQTPSVFLISRGPVFEKVMSNLEEVRARGGPVIAVTKAGDEEVGHLADDVIPVPLVSEPLQPLVTVVPLQLLAYHIALVRGCDIDKPRILAKSVTVE